MWAIWLVVSVTILLTLCVLTGLLPAFRGAAASWRVLSASAIPLGVGGINFIVRFWKPTAGPYLANKLYPYGDHLHAWAVSFGFASLAFALLFVALTLLASRQATWLAWTVLLAAWLIYWLPHGLIALAFTWAGQNRASLEIYQKWASKPGGLVLLIFNALTLLAHFGLSVIGFIMTGIQINRKRQEIDRRAEIRK